MNKRHQRVDEMYETARKAELGGIRVTFNLIFGYPGRNARLIASKRFTTMSDIGRRFWNVSFSPNIFTPYPGIPIWPQLRELGVREPQTLDEWIDLPLGKNVLPWLQGEELNRLQRMLEFFLLNNQIRKLPSSHRLRRKGVRRLLGAPLRWRLRRTTTHFRGSCGWREQAEKLVTRRSLLTGQPLGSAISDVC